MRPVVGIVRGIELQAPASKAVYLKRSREWDSVPPLRNGAFGEAEPLRDLGLRSKVPDYVNSKHEAEFSALDTECKTAEPWPQVGYATMSESRGSRIKYLRKSKGLTQQQLADVLGVSKGLISQWENNQIEQISHSNWMGLLGVLHTTPEFLEFGPDLPKQQPGEGAGKWRKHKR